MPASAASARWRWLLGAVLAAGYALLSHRLMTGAGASALALLVVLGPLAGLGLLGLWGSGRRGLAALGALCAAVIAGLALRGRALPVQWLYLAQHAGVHLALGLWFGATLRAGRQPLISALAQRVHGTLTPAMARYTRQVTQAWVLYFLGIVAVSLLLFAGAELRHWSLFANVLTPLSALAMFAGEYLLRYRLHPEFERVGFLEAVRAYRAHGSELQQEARP